MTSEARERRDQLRAAQLIKLGELSMSSEREGDVHSICLFGELDLATAEAVERELERVEATDTGRSSSISRGLSSWTQAACGSC